MNKKYTKKTENYKNSTKIISFLVSTEGRQRFGKIALIVAIAITALTRTGFISSIYIDVGEGIIKGVLFNLILTFSIFYLFSLIFRLITREKYWKDWK